MTCNIKNKHNPNGNIFIRNTMSKWDNFTTFGEKTGKMGF